MRVPYYIEDLNRDPSLEDYLHEMRCLAVSL